MDKPCATLSGKEPERLEGGTPTAEKDPSGQYKDYWVLPEEERAKGFIRPFRDSYRHVGIRPQYPLRDLTEDEAKVHGKYGYVAYEEYPEEKSPLVGKFWKKDELSSGCNGVTTMGRALSETYARDPSYYGSTFCCDCGAHFPVAQFVWTKDNERVGS